MTQSLRQVTALLLTLLRGDTENRNFGGWLIEAVKCQAWHLLGLLVRVHELSGLVDWVDSRWLAAFRPLVNLGTLVTKIKQGEIDGLVPLAALDT